MELGNERREKIWKQLRLSIHQPFPDFEANLDRLKCAKKHVRSASPSGGFAAAAQGARGILWRV